MRTFPMCFSILQIPRCRIHTLANFWQESFHSLQHRTCRNNSSFRLLGSKANGPEGGYSRRWIRRPISTKTEGTNKITRNSSKSTSIRHEILDETVSTSVNVKKNELCELRKTQYCDIQRKILETDDLAKLVTVIVFDLETTGFSRENERIIEIALQDLQGGENSTFQTLVNPDRYVPNSSVHGITTHMVCRPGIPRMEELIPILLEYIRSRQKPGGYVLLVAHNARTFDVPFLTNEFNRCGVDIPSNWLFVDTVPLAREWMKSEGFKISSRVSLAVLRDTFGIKLTGSAHRAMSDVNTLSLVFQRLTFDLKLTLDSLVAKSFTASDLTNVKKKNSS
ncbi:hypothetical protein P3X46_005538 [Hevea brasiliensis]|uniref:Exonuclease domain-containing protein n=1 Tax=Hevea brasiliensis TaxID=3981 RepID=A0ABQ9N096_HEVBR|nr:exonuclease DPD1, chloroplastic/mitochondrial [Hevea brasiliensis]XP_021645886.1 exonuclease DPD1, chloroplastic/mitochondrial [Hevea brasiliensis]KAJ9185972.1 hypothetical protein P3X46_005538 [Hevea brasiliensis]